MVRQRVIETMESIQDTFDVEAYDRMMRKMWKRGWIETREIPNVGIVQGTALEISPGPGHLGLDWLLKTQNTRLVGLDISERMLRRCRENAEREGVGERAATSTATPATCRLTTARSMPCLPTAGFTNGRLPRTFLMRSLEC